MGKKIIVAVFVLGAVLLAGIYGVTTVFAKSNVERTSVIQKLADRFSLNKNEVEEVFKERRQERWQMRKERQIERLDDAVKNGKITEEQKTLILEKREELRKEAVERRGEFREHREEMRKWAKDNGIDMRLFGREHRIGYFGHFRSGWPH